MMQKSYIAVGGALLLLLSVTFIDGGSDKKESLKTKHVVYVDSPDELVEDDDTLESEKTSTNIVKHDKDKADIKDLLNSVLDGDSSDISFVKNNLSEVFECVECVEKLEYLLSSDELDTDTLKELVTSISLQNNKQSADLLIKAMVESINDEDIDKLSTIESAFENFDSPEVAESFAEFLYNKNEDIKLSEDTKYAIKKIINKTSDRDMVASNLAQIYENLDEDKKTDIANLEHPEMYAVIASNAYKQGDLDTYEMMIDNLSKSTKQEVLNGFMILARKDQSSSTQEIAKVASQWSRENSSQRVMQIAEDYLSRSDTTAQERIVASSIVANLQEADKREYILNKAADHQEDGDVIAHIIEQLEDTKE
jgi:hypothetical protein